MHINALHLIYVNLLSSSTQTYIYQRIPSISKQCLSNLDLELLLSQMMVFIIFLSKERITQIQINYQNIFQRRLMFSFEPQNNPTTQNQTNKNFQLYSEKKHEEVRKHGREELIYQLRSLKINQAEIINWRNYTVSKLKIQIYAINNPFTLFTVLFEICSELGWRKWSSIIEITIQKIHNSIVQNTSVLGHLNKINDFEKKLQNLCYLGCGKILAHLIKLLEAIFKFNHIYYILNEKYFSLAIIHLYKYQINIFWLLSEIEISYACIQKLIQLIINSEKIDQILPFYTIISNFIVSCSDQEANFIIQTSILHTFSLKIFKCENYEVKRQTQLFYNNLIVKNLYCFEKIIKQPTLINLLLSNDNEETWYTVYNIIMVGNKFGISFITKEMIIGCISQLSTKNESVLSIINNLSI